jgi:capsid assembly protease
MKIDDSVFWLGSEASLRHVIDSQQEFNGKAYADDEDEYGDSSRLLTVAEGIGTINVHGSLTNTDSYWNQFFGITSYNEIRNAIVEAVENEEVNRIVLDVDTPGGDAKGVNELSDFITSARAHKPIDSYVSGSAFSAGYWIASATDKLYGPKMSEAGSIGVIAILINRSRAMKERGYDVTVFRGGKYKALANPFEKLTDTAKKIYQAKIDAMEGFFLDAVSENRGIPRKLVKAQVGEGLTFFAEEAVQNGLMDEVVSFDEFFNRLVKQSQTSSAGGRAILSEETDMKKKVITEESVAALASGAGSEAVEELLAEEEVSASDDDTGTDGEAKATDGTGMGEETAEAGTEEIEAGAEEGSDEGSDESTEDEGTDTQASAEVESLMVYLKDEVANLRKENAKFSADLEASKAAAALAQANESALKKIANEYVANMSVGLGMSSINLEGMDTTIVLKQYEEVRTQFTTRFNIGSSAGVKDDKPESSGDGDGMTMMERASVAANKI